MKGFLKVLNHARNFHVSRNLGSILCKPTEVKVRFNGFGADDDEWVNVRTGVRQRSLPCEASECVSVLPGDLILCFKEGSEQALYFDAHVLEVDRRRHDIRGCRCRFLVQYNHDESTDIVPLRKVCRRPETEYRAPANFSIGNGLITDTYAAEALPTKSNGPDVQEIKVL